MEDESYGLVKPHILDVKIGAKPWDPEASPEKQQRQKLRCPHLDEICFQILGARVSFRYETSALVWCASLWVMFLVICESQCIGRPRYVYETTLLKGRKFHTEWLATDLENDGKHERVHNAFCFDLALVWHPFASLNMYYCTIAPCPVFHKYSFRELLDYKGTDRGDASNPCHPHRETTLGFQFQFTWWVQT